MDALDTFTFNLTRVVLCLTMLAAAGMLITGIIFGVGELINFFRKES